MLFDCLLISLINHVRSILEIKLQLDWYEEKPALCSYRKENRKWVCDPEYFHEYDLLVSLSREIECYKDTP